ncbi:FAD-linked oxidoreductase [Amylocystis lapponica]|nr:FAD-linked oxidoreductase [Amylocystis lapponica]
MVEETIHCIDVAADFEDRYAHGSPAGRKTWVAVKLTALLPRAESLISLSKYLVASRPAPHRPIAFPGIPLPTDLDVLSARSAGPLTETDIIALRELRADLGTICKRAQERGVRIIIDAEHSWYQPAIDAFGLSLMREFNKLPVKSSSWFRSSKPAPSMNAQPLVYATFQAYLHRNPEYLAQSLEAAHAGGYALGVKLVRGAYHPHELAAHASATSISTDAVPPVWLSKPETDACYDACAALLVGYVARAPEHGLGILFGTHNWASAERVLGELVRSGLAGSKDGVVSIPDTVAEHVAIGQLYGMSDALTNHLVDRTRCSTPFVLKYIPYGNLAEVMPYLSRRAIENKSVLGNGGAADERRRAGAEIWQRLFG